MGFCVRARVLQFFGQLQSMRSGEPDPAPIASKWVLLIKGVAVALAIAALLVSLKRLPDDKAIQP